MTSFWGKRLNDLSRTTYGPDRRPRGGVSVTSSVPLSEVFSLICSFPLLEDLRLRLATRDNTASDGWEAPLTSPKLTGTLQQSGEIRSTSRRLLGLPSGLHFSKIVVRCRAVDVDFAKDLVMKCSDTLESLCIEYISSGAFPSAAVVCQ